MSSSKAKASKAPGNLSAATQTVSGKITYELGALLGVLEEPLEPELELGLGLEQEQELEQEQQQEQPKEQLLEPQSGQQRSGLSHLRVDNKNKIRA